MAALPPKYRLTNADEDVLAVPLRRWCWCKLEWNSLVTSIAGSFIGVLLLIVSAFLANGASLDFASEHRAAIYSTPQRTSCNQVWSELMAVHNKSVTMRNRLLDTPGKFVGEKMRYDPFEPSFTCQFEQRVGKAFGDGGKFICGPDEFFSSRSCLVYSIGSNGDFSFETSVREKFGCEIHTFDPTGNTTLYSAAAVKAGVSFYPWGLAGAKGSMVNPANGKTNPLLPLPEIVKRLGHTKRHIDILKVDCEGCEYASFSTIWESIRLGDISVGQVSIELHNLNMAQITKFFKQAHEADFFVFHKERNHWGCQGYLCVEFSLIANQTAFETFKHLREDC